MVMMFVGGVVSLLQETYRAGVSRSCPNPYGDCPGNMITPIRVPVGTKDFHQIVQELLDS